MQRPPVRGLPASARLCCPPPWPLPCCPGPSASFGLKPVPLPDPSSDPFSSRSPLRPRDGPPASRSAPGWSGGVWLHLGGPALTFLPGGGESLGWPCDHGVQGEESGVASRSFCYFCFHPESFGKRTVVSPGRPPAGSTLCVPRGHMSSRLAETDSETSTG